MIGITFIENIMVAVMLAVIAIAVGFFVLSGIMLKQFDDIKYKQCRVDYQSASYIQNECDHMRTIHSLCLSIGVALCVMSVIPPIIIDAGENFFRCRVSETGDMDRFWILGNKKSH